jgi:hypothetical protein
MSSRNPQPMSMQWNFQRRWPTEQSTINPVFRVAVQGSDIVITASGTEYVMIYHMPTNSRQLIAKSFPRKEDRRVSMTLADFLTAAYKLANDKAREVGWIA